jgi:5-deoxy-D-glucuronate isomerase
MYATSGGVGGKKFFSNGSQKINIISNSQALNLSPNPTTQMFLPANSHSTAQGIGSTSISMVSGSGFQKPPRKFIVPLVTNKESRTSGNNLDHTYNNEANDVSVNSIVTTAIGDRGNIKI